MVSEGAKKESRLPRPPRYALPTAASAEAKRQILAEYNYTGPAVGNAGTPVARKRKSEGGESPAGSPKRRGYARGVLAAGADDNVDLEDVPALLAERMVGKSKFDYKGKCEQMSSYIKRLRAACSVMLDQTSGFSGERERLSAMLVELDEKHAVERDALKDLQSKLEGDLANLTKAKAAVEGKLQAACADNLKLSKDAQDKTEALATHKASVKSLEDDLSSLKAAKAECEERIKEQADAHDKLQAYNVDLQKYNSKMSAEAEKHAEIVSALQTEKAGVQSELAASQGQCATLEGSVAASKEQLADANARRSELEDKLANVESELKQATATLTSTKAELAASEAALAKSKQEAESRAADIKELTEAKFSVEAELQAASAQAASLGEKVSAIEAELLASKEESAALQGKLSAAQEQHAALAAEVEGVKAAAAAAAEAAAASLAQAEAAAAEAAAKADADAQAAAAAAAAELAAAQEAAGAELAGVKDAATRREAELQAGIDEYRLVTGKSAQELKEHLQHAVDLSESCATQEEMIEQLKTQLAMATQRVNVLEQGAGDAQKMAERLSARNAELEEGIAIADKKVEEMESMRRKLHNQIQELKGNIRVFCRVRPPSNDDMEEDGPVSFPPGSADTRGRCIALDAGPKSGVHDFTFDKVFAPHANQADVFDEVGQLVQSALDGYRVCIFAYGQTGSGKTHTMLGSSSNAEDDGAGLIPRALAHIFSSSEALAAKGWEFNMTASMLEVYNEMLQDLLKEDASKPKRKAQPMDEQKPPPKLDIKHDGKSPATVVGATTVEVGSREELQQLLDRALRARSIGKTAMNERSSRSHCVFTLRIQGACAATDEEVDGVLNLIDLAGSERLSRSGATGDRAKETAHINKSLAALGDVIKGLAAGDKHVPFRNSKLTYLLQPCLGGDAKCLMFVNVAHEESSASESLCSLRFAQKVNACEIRGRK